MEEDGLMAVLLGMNLTRLDNNANISPAIERNNFLMTSDKH
jgi:hypothetical protein